MSTLNPYFEMDKVSNRHTLTPEFKEAIEKGGALGQWSAENPFESDLGSLVSKWKHASIHDCDLSFLFRGISAKTLAFCQGSVSWDLLRDSIGLLSNVSVDTLFIPMEMILNIQDILNGSFVNTLVIVDEEFSSKHDFEPIIARLKETACIGNVYSATGHANLPQYKNVDQFYQFAKMNTSLRLNPKFKRAIETGTAYSTRKTILWTPGDKIPEPTSMFVPPHTTRKNSLSNVSWYSNFALWRDGTHHKPRGILRMFGELSIEKVMPHVDLSHWSPEAFSMYAPLCCSDAVSVALPHGISALPDGSFSHCSNLSEIFSSSDKLAIDAGAFINTHIPSIKGPKLTNVNDDMLNFMSLSSFVSFFGWELCPTRDSDGIACFEPFKESLATISFDGSDQEHLYTVEDVIHYLEDDILESVIDPMRDYLFASSDEEKWFEADLDELVASCKKEGIQYPHVANYILNPDYILK